jgi:hypothetical protein
VAHEVTKNILLNPVTFEHGVVARRIDGGLLVERPPLLASGEVDDAHVAAHGDAAHLVAVGGLAVVV